MDRKSISILVLFVIALFSIGGMWVLSQQSQQKSGKDISTTQDKKVQVGVSGVPDDCSGEVMPSLTEGPYYTPETPERTDIREGAPGEDLTITGFVFDENCNPVANAWLDFWQADGEGNYDNEGYVLRGHQYTDAEGKYILHTVIPAEYPGRTPHIHLKIRATEASPVITSQLFLPGAKGNESDSIFDERLIISMQGENAATYNFVIPTQ